MTSTMTQNGHTYGNKANELDLLLEDLSHARYNGGPQTTEHHHEESYKSSSIVQRLNGYHPESQIVPNFSKTDDFESSILTQEEETIIEEETKKYQFQFKDPWDKRERSPMNKPIQTTTVYATVNTPTAPTSYHVEETIDEITQTLEWSKLRQIQVDMPVNMEVPDIDLKLHEKFEKPGIKELQQSMDLSLRKRLMEEVAEAEQEEVTYVMPELPEAPKRPEPICAACTKSISGRCITAMMRKFHPEHFVCSYCLKQLNKGTFKEREEKPYCQECFYRLFG